MRSLNVLQLAVIATAALVTLTCYTVATRNPPIVIDLRVIDAHPVQHWDGSV